jgi:hypothetical protein
VVTLVCIGIGVGVAIMNSRPKPPPVISYQADMIVKIGQKLLFSQSTGVSTEVVYIVSPEAMVVTLPLEYGAKENVHGYKFDVDQFGEPSMLKLTLTGPDIGVGRVLKEMVDMLVEEHRRKTEASVAAYTSFINKLEADTVMIQENINIAEESIKEIKRRGVEHLDEMVASELETGEENDVGGGRTAFMDMLYLKTIDLERDLRGGRNDLRSTQWQLILYQTSMGDIGKYSTEIIGEVASTAIELKKKDTTNVIIVAVIAGLTMAIFMAFFVEYIEESKSRRKGK